VSRADVNRAAAHFRLSPPPELVAADITIAVDNMGREVVVVPDAVAAELSYEVRRGWLEDRDGIYGESRRFAPGTWAYTTTVLILATYAASPISETITRWPEPDHGGKLFTPLTHEQQAVRHRERAAGPRGEAAGSLFIIGRTGWDFRARWWALDVRSLAHRALRPYGYPHLHDQLGGYAQFTG
jgi:hypothetical protein